MPRIWQERFSFGLPWWQVLLYLQPKQLLVLDKRDQERKRDIKSGLAILGRPNVGKSTFWTTPWGKNCHHEDSADNAQQDYGNYTTDKEQIALSIPQGFTNPRQRLRLMVEFAYSTLSRSRYCLLYGASRRANVEGTIWLSSASRLHVLPFWWSTRSTQHPDQLLAQIDDS